MPALYLKSRQGSRASSSERMRRVGMVAAQCRAFWPGKAQVQEPVVQINTCVDFTGPTFMDPL